MPKWPPTPFNFDPKDKFAKEFISASACLFATLFKITIPFENPWEPINKLKMAEIASGFEVKEF